MAMAIRETYNAGTGADDIIREDLSDFVYNISPTETPVLQAAEWTTASSTIHDWVEDTLAAPAANAQAEGAALGTPANVSGGARLSNYTQISSKTYGVSGTVEVVSKVGRDSEIAFGRAKSMRELKKDIDLEICQAGAKVAGSSGTAREIAGLPSWVRNADRGATGADPVSFDGAVTDTDGTGRAFTELILNNVIEECWNNGGRPSLLVMGGKGRKEFRTFDGVGNTAANNTTRTDRADATVYGTVDLYISSFGIELRAVNSRHLRLVSTTPKDAWLIDPEHIKVPFLRPFQIIEFGKTGDSIEERVLAEWTLEVCNTYAHGLCADIDG
jgi:hypothetical protein